MRAWRGCRTALAALPLLAAALLVGPVSAMGGAVGAKTPVPPVFPEVYTMKYIFSMPHFYLTQPEGLKYDVTVWFDGPGSRRRVEAYGGVDSIVTVGGIDYTVIPRINEYDCDIWGEPGREVYSPLPDLYLWEYGGTVQLGSNTADIWQRQIKEGDKVSQYVFYVSPSGVPLRLNMLGVNYLTNAHFDEYVYEFTHFDTALPNNATGLFDVPAVCTEKLAKMAKLDAEAAAGGAAAASGGAAADASDAAAGGSGAAGGVEGAATKAAAAAARQHPAAWQLGAMLPDIQAYDHNRAYNLWSRAHGRVHAHAGEYDARLERFRASVDLVKTHNSRADASYTLSLNHWADWHEDEWRSAMLPNRRTKSPLPEGDDDALLSELPGPYAPAGRLASTLNRKELPASVDWRGTGADPGIKDQGMCGSCYAFAATGAMDGAWYVATGQRRSFSEQQIVDCAFDYGPNGCFGGYYQPVFRYVSENGGIALEQDYSYRGEVGWCRSANHTLVGQFDGYLAVESRNELALMEAVYKYGPVAVSVYADLENFRYFSEGVYDEKDCSTRMRDLDHTVTLFGYGTTDDGKDYWLVRNSWAKFYGDDGYIKIRRGDHDCGIATDAAVALVAQQHVVRGAREAAQRQAAKWK